MSDFVFKVIVVGQSGVGKTAIVQRYVQQFFLENEHPTIGVDIGVKTLEIEGSRIQLKIWDSAGSERFKSLTTCYYRNADAAILVYCINDSKTLHELHSWASEVSNRQSEMVKILVGNKNDLEGERTISHQTAVEFAMMENLDLAIECSAKSDDNVDYIFYTIARRLMIKEIEKVEKSNRKTKNSKTKKRGRTADEVVNYQGSEKSMEHLFFEPNDRRKRKNTTTLSNKPKEKSLFQRLCIIL